MTEVNPISQEWVTRTSDVDEIWVPSHHSAQAFTDAGIASNKIQVIPEPIDPGM